MGESHDVRDDMGDDMRHRPLILGHRGASAHVTENTLDAFVAARDAGADGIELDVQLCATGELVVFHDVDLARMAGRGERISAMPWSALRHVRLNHDRRVPLLGDVLDEMCGDGFVINIELKSPGLGRAAAADALVDGVLAALADHGVAPSSAGEEACGVLISSFDPFVIRRVRRKAPALQTGLLFHGDEPLPLRRAWPAPLLKPYALHPEFPLVTRDNMDRWQQRGYAINVWTVDHPAEIRRLASLGVDAIITNDPAAARAAL